jgi:hypothetical protein
MLLRRSVGHRHSCFPQVNHKQISRSRRAPSR